jgi:hypothetical protein
LRAARYVLNVLGKKKPSVLDPRVAPERPRRPKIPAVVLIRMFLLGSVAVIASIYAIWRHYTVPRTPMLEPVPAAAPASSSFEIEIEPGR